MTAPELIDTQLHRLLGIQQAAFAKGAPGYARRRQALLTLGKALKAHQNELVRAVSEDFDGRAEGETLVAELFLLHDQIRHTRGHMKRWMRRRSAGSNWFLLPAKSYYQYQPLGVVGIIGAWNYQLLLTLGPAIDAIAAGNHVMLKPSELAPRTAEAIAQLVKENFSADYITCVTGGPDVAGTFSSLPFDHLFFTGSTSVGHKVMATAAQNLTPVTLELGGKSPAIIHSSYSLGRAVERIVTAKLLNAGQTCVAPDYVLLPEDQAPAFESQARQAVARLYPTLAGNPDYTSIINERHYQRLQGLLAGAKAGGARVVDIGPRDEPAAGAGRKLSPTLIFSASDDLPVMRDEIFGPILPIVTYRTLDEAIDYVNARPKPLALYYFDENRQRQNRVLNQTLSGGVTFNDCIYHLAQHGIPFGGVGPSGMGHYHGFDGFATFSKKRGVMLQRRFASTSMLHAPWNKRRRALIKLMMWTAAR